MNSHLSLGQRLLLPFVVAVLFFTGFLVFKFNPEIMSTDTYFSVLSENADDSDIAIKSSLFAASAASLDTPAPTPSVKPQRYGHDFVADENFHKVLLGEEKSEWQFTDHFFISHSPHTLKVFDAEGNLKWTFAPLTNSTLTAGDLPIYGSTLVATTEQGLIYAFEISNGQVVWHMRTEYKFFFSPIIVGQNLLLYTEMQGGQKWNLTPVQLKTLEVKDPVGPYELPLSGQPLRTPNALIFATQTGHLTAIDLETLSSKAKWSAVGSSGFRSSPAEFGDRIYIGNEDGIIVVYDKRNGKKMNEIDLGSNLQTPLKFKESANMGAVVDTTGNLSTFDPKKRAWKFNLGASAANMPVELYQLSMHSLGKLSFNSDVRGWSAWAPCQSTHLCIFDLKKGAVLHRIDLQAAMGSRFAIFNDALWVDVKDKDGFWLKKFVSRAQATEGSGAEKRP